jgi:quinolinate synthase
MGVLYKLKNDSPDKKFYMMSGGFVCPNMKKIKLDSVLYSLTNLKYKITVPEDTRKLAVHSLEKMLEVSGR